MLSCLVVFIKKANLTAQKMKFSLKISSVNVTADLVTCTEEFLNRKLHFLCSVYEVNLLRQVQQYA